MTTVDPSPNNLTMPTEEQTQTLSQTQAFQKLIDLAFALVNATVWETNGFEAHVDTRKTAKVNPDVYDELAIFLHKDCPKPTAPKVLVEIGGGMCNGIWSSDGFADMDATLRDLDNIDQGDEDPLDAEGDFVEPEDLAEKGYPNDLTY